MKRVDVVEHGSDDWLLERCCNHAHGPLLPCFSSLQTH